MASLWTMRSAYHNLPRIGEWQQAAGREFAARDVAAVLDDDRAELWLDIAPAYPPAAGLRRWQRVMCLEREPARVVLEEFTLAAAPPAITLHLMSAGPVESAEPGQMRIQGAGRALRIDYDAALFTPSVDTIAIAAARLRPVWGDRVYRVSLALRYPVARGGW